jgi:ribosomal protein S18 acetylase RimI-like enzyme
MSTIDGPELEVLHVKDWPVEEVVGLYKAGGWWKDVYDPSGIPDLIRGSADFVITYDRNAGRAVGMGRLISDGVSDGYIQDLVVLPEIRGKGIGAMMVRELVGSGLDRGLVWIGLIAEEGTEEFYEGLGFAQFPGRPMLYMGGQR